MKKKVIIGIVAAILVGTAIVCGICSDGFTNVQTKLVGSDNTPIECTVGPGTPEPTDASSYEEAGEEVAR